MIIYIFLLMTLSIWPIRTLLLLINIFLPFQTTPNIFQNNNINLILLGGDEDHDEDDLPLKHLPSSLRILNYFDLLLRGGRWLSKSCTWRCLIQIKITCWNFWGLLSNVLNFWLSFGKMSINVGVVFLLERESIILSNGLKLMSKL